MPWLDNLMFGQPTSGIEAQSESLTRCAESDKAHTNA
jgi:hypothetical protein